MRMTGKEKNIIVDLFDHGFNYTQIHKKVGITKSCIRDYLVKIGKVEPVYKKVLSREDSIQALRLHQNGKNLKEVAKKFGVSDKNVSKSFIHHKLVDPTKKMRRSNDEIDVEKIINLFQSGLSLTKISKTISLNHHRISDILEERGLRKKGNSVKGLTKEDALKMSNLQKKGVSYKDIGKRFSCSQAAVVKCLRRYGLKEERVVVLEDDEIDKESIIKDYLSGKSMQNIGKKFKMGSYRVREILHKNGVQTKSAKYGEDMGDKIQDLYENSGLSMKAIAKKLNIERKVVYRFKKERELKRKIPCKDIRKKRLPWKEGWIKEYGKEAGEKRWEEYQELQRSNNSGKKNSMYGKPSPMGSGYGIKGWHKGRFFRSLRELSFMLNYIDRFKLKEESLERRKYRIPYIDPMGVDRTYAGDFLINNKFFVEIKPKKLWESPSVKAKAEAGIKFCEERGWNYKLIDPIVNNDQVVKEYLAGNIKFNEKSLEKFLEFNNLKSSPE